MSQFAEMIEAMKTVDFSEKKQFLQVFMQIAEKSKRRLSKDDTAALLEYAYGEITHMLQVIPQTSTYREKDIIFECEDLLLGLIMQITDSPNMLPEDKLVQLKSLIQMVHQERYIEVAVDNIFQQPAITDTDIKELLSLVGKCTDEYQKCKLYMGISHYQQDMGKLSDTAKQCLGEYIASELQRLMPLGTQDSWNALELLADISKYFVNERIISGLMELMQLGRNHINCYAVDTLCSMGLDVPQPVIDALARDLEYAYIVYKKLQWQGKASLFPAECATEEYLAKSDLVQWLTYPTELGKAPDEIVYLGKVKQLFKREVFHIFKYRSNSSTLDDSLKNKWLIGWSSEDGGTFSNFEEFAPYERDTIEKTLKLIKKKIIG